MQSRLYLERLSATASFPIAAQTKAAKPMRLNSATTAPVIVLITGCVLLSGQHIRPVQRLQRFDDLVIGDGVVRAGIKAKSRNGFDGEDVGCSRRKNGAFLVPADFVGRKDVARMTKMFAWMQQMGDADCCCRVHWC